MAKRYSVTAMQTAIPARRSTKTDMVRVRMSKDERERGTIAAEAIGISLSELIRRGLSREIGAAETVKSLHGMANRQEIPFHTAVQLSEPFARMGADGGGFEDRTTLALCLAGLGIRAMERQEVADAVRRLAEARAMLFALCNDSQCPADSVLPGWLDTVERRLGEALAASALKPVEAVV